MNRRLGSLDTLKFWGGENKIVLIGSKGSLDDQNLNEINLILSEIKDSRKTLMIMF